METVATIQCSKCKTAVQLQVRKPDAGEASILLVATNVTLPCGHTSSDDRRWSGQVAELGFAPVA